ncbi:ABC-type xenobiotic transporter [Malassezia caprae]|uniref:ABC-type xenobiotic transporter n=1 Tax=Malassezia caprae TaxID=1381934 RepID=A0AAF0E5K8_9BASI|nr:ABC-type xenobiotic transporter [Malassezia caprae]
MVRASELSAMYFVVTVLYAIGFWWGSIQVAKGRESMQGVVTSFFNYLNTLFSLTMVVAHFQAILDCLTTLHEMRIVIERQPEIDIRDTSGLILGIPSSKAVEAHGPTYDPSFQLEDVTFAYPGRPSEAWDFVCKLPEGMDTIISEPSFESLKCYLMISLVNLLSTLIMTLILNWLLSVTVLAGMVTLLVASFLNVYAMEKYEVKMQEPVDRSSSYIAEIIDAIGTVSSLGREAEVLSHFDKTCILSGSFMPSLLFGSAAYGYTQFALCGISGLMMYWGIVIMSEGKADMHTILSVFESVFVAVFASIRLATFMPDLARARFGQRVISGWLQRAPEVASTGERAAWPPNHPRDIVFNDVELRYPQRPQYAAIKNLNLVIPEKTTVAFCGTSGSGKSSTLGLLQRFYEPCHGSITYGGLDLRSIPLHLWRSEMAYVSQEPVLYEGTLRWNLLLGAVNPDLVTEADIEFVCRQACVWDFAMALPNGLDTEVGHKGSSLSGGQCQRVCIARALIRKPRILLLDEATSALDAESEVLVQRALDNAASQCTTITIAHRLSTIRRSDIICVVEDGEIVERGSHESLLAQRGRYFELVEAQL